MPRQALGPAAIGENPQDTFAHGQQGFKAHPGTIQRQGHQRVAFQVTTPEPNGAAAGDRKHNAAGRVYGLPQQIQSQVGDGFDVAIDGTRGGVKQLLVGFEDRGEFEGFSIDGGTTSRGCGPRWGWFISHIVLLGSRHDGQERLLKAKRPPRRGEVQDRGNREAGVEDEERGRVMTYRTLQGHGDQPHRQGGPLGLVRLVIVHVGETLMSAGFKGQAQGLGP